MKLTSLMFGLLLAVGWTSNASAQALPETRADKYMVCLDGGGMHSADMAMTQPGAMLHKTESRNNSGAQFFAPLRAETRDMVSITAKEAEKLTYSYVDYNGVLHEDVPSTEVATDPCQMYSLLRFIYKTKDFPGPYTSAYTADGVPEREVYYGPIAGGWNLGTPPTMTVTEMPNITLTTSSGSVYYRSITVTDANTNAVITSWNYNGSTHEWTSSTGTTYTHYDFPSGWYSEGYNFFGQTTLSSGWNTYYYGYFTSGSDPHKLVIHRSLLEGHSRVTISVRAYSDNSSTIKVNDGTTYTVSSQSATGTNYSWTITPTQIQITNQKSDLYKPTQEGYTALVVSVNNNAQPMPDVFNDYDDVNKMSTFNDSSEIVEYFKTHVNYIKLLTDGVRISDAGGNPGTVFNCSGTYNKFFFLGKGQARQKDPDVIRLERTYGLMGERVPFKEMYEEFSPTTGFAGDQITDFYDRMREGSVYDVVHDCAAVIDNGHQFSMSGNTGVTSYPLTGLNFFIPDYRLAYWTKLDQWGEGRTVDGRTMNPYQDVNGDVFFRVPSYCSNYAQYNPQYAPKVGIYKITLSATATFVGDDVNPDHSENNLNYVVTLQWVSSLDEMSGTTVPQTYTIYCFDNVTGEKFELTATGVTNPTGQTTVSYLVPQRAHSYTIEYIIEGRPSDTAHPTFVAWSNRDNVVIPGWDDFIGLQLNHHESDFITSDMANWYRNFLEVVNQDIFSGLTADKVEDGMDEFTLYRFLYEEQEQQNPTTGETEVVLVPTDSYVPIAKLQLGVRDNQGNFIKATNDDGNVPYKVSYINTQDVEDYTLKYKEDNTEITVPDAYSVENLEVPLTGVIRLKGNGDLVIWPSSYQVNFRSIKVYNNNTLVAEWNYEMDELPDGWILSPGSKWEEFVNSSNGLQVGYMEGGGYIAIPGIVTETNVDDLRVEIEAFGDGSSVSKIIVNDHTQTIANGTVKTYTWGGTGEDAIPISPKASPRRDNTNNNSNN